MRATVIAMAAAAVFLSGCSGSTVDSGRLNPLNWFQTNTEPETELAVTAVQDERELIPVISGVQAQPFGGGGSIILIATGIPSTFGYYDAALVPVNEGKPVDGELVLELRANAPDGEVETGSEQSREISVATTLTERQLEGVQSVRVIGAVNEQVIIL
ncbi:MAG: hypothetical protein J4F49_01635 [Rhodobacteraceae bacterium]|nr:hypothetical protein [Paracoccaceae bacterium]